MGSVLGVGKEPPQVGQGRLPNLFRDLREAGRGTLVNPNFCRRCGTRLKPSSRFCPQCGREVTVLQRHSPTQVPTGTAQFPQLPSRAHRRPIFGHGRLVSAAMTLIVLLILGAGCGSQ